MSPLDLTAIEQALDALYAKAPHLPRPDGLAQVVLDAYNDRSDPPDSPCRWAGVVAALWPIGAAAGAERGHAVTVGAIRGAIALALADPSPDPRGRWVVMGMASAADDLPDRPNPVRRYGASNFEILDQQQTLVQTLAVGLNNSWRAGHNHATERLLGRFVDAVVDLVGQERLVTTFLTPTLPAYALLEEIGFAAYRMAEADREHPATRTSQAQAAQMQTRAIRPAVSRAFVTVRRTNPHRRAPFNYRPRPSTGPRHAGPGR
jgi:hypothetical protein